MKKLFIPLVVVATFMFGDALALKAYSYPGFNKKLQHHMQHIQKVANASPYAAKTTAVDVRLIATGNSVYDGSVYVLQDSVIFAYGGGRGGVLNDRWPGWNWDFDESVTYDNDGTAYGLYYKEMTTYTPDNKMNTYIDQYWESGVWENNYRDTFMYNSSGLLATTNIFEWSAGVWVAKYRVNFTYNSAGKMTNMVQEEWDGTVWDSLVKEEYTWDVSNRLTRWQVWFRSGSAWQNAIRNSHTYDASNNRTNTIAEQWFSPAWDTSLVLYSGFISNHLPQIEVIQEKNTTTSVYENSSRTTYSYNTYGKPDYEFSETWDAITGSWAVADYDYRMRYHYENYTTTGVQVPMNLAADVAVYPVPATTSININASWANATHYNAAITDVAGRVHMRWTSPEKTKTHHETLAVDHLPAGNYILTLQTNEGNVVKQFTIVR